MLSEDFCLFAFLVTKGGNESTFWEKKNISNAVVLVFVDVFASYLFAGVTTVLTTCSPRDSQESSQTAQVKSINSLAFSLYGPTLTSIDDYCKNHSFD